MTADCPTDFPYEPKKAERDPAKLRKYWGIAKGLQAVDGLESSDYMSQLTEESINGIRSIADTGELIRSYYKRNHNGVAGHSSRNEGIATGESSSEEADLVTQRIAELLERGAFLFAPEDLSIIHAYLFQDLDKKIYKPGEFKTDPLLKREAILNGDSVSYADPSLIEASLKVAFEDEVGFDYGTKFDDAALENLARFVSRIWQVHPFVEGNTRTIAVFCILYLNDMGYEITNEPFEQHARYFRDSLVRAIYRNPKAGVFPNTSYLEGFLDGVLNGADRSFDSDDLRVDALFEDSTLLRNLPPQKE